jgi:siroheme synthase
MPKVKERDPVKYRVKEQSLIGNEMHAEGAIVEYAGLPAENLEPQCAEGEARYQEYLASNSERVVRLGKQYGESQVGDPAAFLKAMQEHSAAQAEAITEAVAAGIAAGLARAAAEQNPVKGKKDSLA